MAEVSEHPRRQTRKPRVFRLDSAHAGVIIRAKQTQFSPFLTHKKGSGLRTNPIVQGNPRFGIGFSPGLKDGDIVLSHGEARAEISTDDIRRSP